MAQLRVVVAGRIPRRVMEGHYPMYETVPQVFLQTLIQRFLEKVYDSYVDRSILGTEPDMSTPKGGFSPVEGQTDQYGNSWEQLKPKTYRIKQKLWEEGGSQDYLSQRAGDYETDRIGEVMQRVGSVAPISGDNINIRTGELLAAYLPPAIIGNQIVPGPNQNIEMGNSLVNLRFTTDLVLKEQTVEKYGRPIIPQGMAEVWMQESIDEALDAAEEEFERLLNLYGHTRMGRKSG